MSKVNWNPVRIGGTYCSSACGAGCLHVDFEWATAQAKALAEELGKDWKPRVHENLGWFCSAVNGYATVSSNLNWARNGKQAVHGRKLSYTCYLNLPTRQFLGEAATAGEAYKQALSCAALFVSNIQTELRTQQKGEHHGRRANRDRAPG